MNNASYWARATQAKSTRRRFLQTSGAGLTAAALLTACGGTNNSSQKTSGLVTIAQDTVKTAKRGGVFKHYKLTEPARGLDPYIRDITTTELGRRVYNTLWRIKPQINEPTDEGNLEPLLLPIRKART